MIMVTKLLKLLLLLSPICYGVNIPLEKFDIVFFVVSMMALFIASLLDTPKREIPKEINFAIISLWIIGLFNLFLNTFNQIVLSAFIHLSFVLIGIVIVARYIEEPKKLFKWIIWAGIINITVLLLQKIGYNPILDDSEIAMRAGEPGGIMGNAPQLGTYLALTFPIALSLNLWLGVLFIGAGILIKEYTIVLAAFVLLILPAKKELRILLVILFLSLIGFLYKEIAQSLFIRWQLWKPTIEMIFNKPLLGYGLGIFPYIANQFVTTTTHKIDYLFNSYLQFIFSVGILGAIWLVWVIKKFIKKFINTADFSVLVLLILCIVEYPLEIPRLWITITAVIGFYIIGQIKKESVIC